MDDLNIAEGTRMKRERVFRSLKTVLFVLIAFAAIIAAYIIIPGSILPKRVLFPIAAVFAVVFTLLGAALIFLTVTLKIRGMLRFCLILTGASAVGFLVSIVLHNVVYGLMICFFGEDFWERIGMSDEPFFFCMAVFVCPILFLVGAVSSIVLFIRTR